MGGKKAQKLDMPLERFRNHEVTKKSFSGKWSAGCRWSRLIKTHKAHCWRLNTSKRRKSNKCRFLRNLSLKESGKGNEWQRWMGAKDRREIAQVRANTIQQPRTDVHAALQHGACIHCLEEWHDSIRLFSPLWSQGSNKQWESEMRAGAQQRTLAINENNILGKRTTASRHAWKLGKAERKRHHFCRQASHEQRKTKRRVGNVRNKAENEHQEQ